MSVFTYGERWKLLTSDLQRLRRNPGGVMTGRSGNIADRSRRSAAGIHRVLPLVAALAIPFAAGQAWSGELDFHVRGSVRQFFVIAAPAQPSSALDDAT